MEIGKKVPTVGTSAISGQPALGSIPDVSLDECRHIVRDFESSVEKRRENLLSPQGFSHFMIFSDYHDIVEASTCVEQVESPIILILY